MAIFEGMFKSCVESKNVIESKKEITEDNAKLSLRKEELDIAKSKIQKGDVEIGKEIVEAQINKADDANIIDNKSDD